MANRIFVCAVFALWLGSMSWLMVDRILPSLQEGEAPIAAGYELGKPVAWRVYWGDREVGQAASMRVPGVLNTTNLVNRVVLEDVPLLDLVPALMRRVVGDIGTMKFDAYTNLQFDSLDNFSNFRSHVSINDVRPVLHLHGKVNGAFLELKVHFSEVTYEPKVPIGDRAALNEALFPEAKLPYLYLGRRWTEEVYNPFRTPTAPVETLEAEVTGRESITLGDETHRVMRVEYRAQPAPGVPEEERLQAIAWVSADDGLVLQQDVMISSSKLRFQRIAEDEAEQVGKRLLDRPDVDRRLFPGSRRGRGYGYGRRRGEQRSEAEDARGEAWRQEYMRRRAEAVERAS